MTEPRDPFETWLHTQVEPLPPPPGTFGQIKRRARRRKMRRAAMSAASAGVAAGVIVLAVVALPKVVPSVLHTHSHPVADAGPHYSPTATPGTTQSQSFRATSSATPAPGTRAHPPAPVPVPANFAPTSVTFVGLHTGWVIGQAGTPGTCYNPNDCTSIARTDNAGKSWYGLHAPVTTGPDGSTGVSQLRFLNTRDGWAFGPQLYVTHDGGYEWIPEGTSGLRVTSLETVGNEAFAVFAKCTGTGADFAADCSRFRLYSSAAGSDSWAPVPGMPSFGAAAGTGAGGPDQGAGSAMIVLAGTQGYLYTPSGALLSGPVTGTVPWTAAGSSSLPCGPGAAAPDGRPAGGQLAASAPGDLALACPGPGNQVTVYTSASGGSSWQPAGTLTVAGTATSLAASTGGILALATTQGIYASADNGQNWHPAVQGVTGGFSYVGLTSPMQGVAVPADPSVYQAVWFTRDGGTTWQQSAVRNG